MKNEWDEYAKNWDSDASVAEYAHNAYADLNKMIDLEGLCVLDFGCGTGALTKIISAKASRIVAIDPSTEMISYLDKKAINNVKTIADFLSLELIKTNSNFNTQFDLIIASSVCSFLPNYEETLGILTSLLKTGGTFIQWDWMATSETSEFGFSLERVNTALALQQFKKIRVEPSFVMCNSNGEMPVLMAYGVK